ncbi:hypothetical protein [Bacillus salipaludis]|uniref:Uncharacterized protein n=1 Tax=Bacillus salipaludis TaxID=2547811 RepID=A0ABW8REH0_9BACI
MNKYDHHFNGNEWFVIIALIFGILVVYFLPWRFPKQIAIVFVGCGIFFGFFFDQTLSVLPVSFYDIGDTSHFEVIDFLSQCMYGPYSYLFFYLYDRLTISPRFSPIYILVWTFISTGFEKVADMIGVFHYKHGYNIYFSFVLYLGVLSIWVMFYYFLKAYGHKQFKSS